MRRYLCLGVDKRRAAKPEAADKNQERGIEFHGGSSVAVPLYSGPDEKTNRLLPEKENASSVAECRNG